MNYVGLIPAAGRAERLHGLPKYLLPVAHTHGYLLNVLAYRMRMGGASQIVIGANAGNLALIDQYAPDDALIYRTNSETVCQTVLAGRRYCGDRRVLYGMPDSYWGSGTRDSDGIFGTAARDHKSVIVAICWRAREAQKSKLGMVDVREDKERDRGNLIPSSTPNALSITRLVDKPATTDLTYAWGALIWSPEFWDYIHADDPHMGFALTRWMAEGRRLRAVIGPGEYWDCGTFDEYAALVGGKR